MSMDYPYFATVQPGREAKEKIQGWVIPTKLLHQLNQSFANHGTIHGPQDTGGRMGSLEGGMVGVEILLKKGRRWQGSVWNAFDLYWT